MDLNGAFEWKVLLAIGLVWGMQMKEIGVKDWRDPAKSSKDKCDIETCENTFFNTFYSQYSNRTAELQGSTKCLNWHFIVDLRLKQNPFSSCKVKRSTGMFLPNEAMLQNVLYQMTWCNFVFAQITWCKLAQCTYYDVVSKVDLHRWNYHQFHLHYQQQKLGVGIIIKSSAVSSSFSTTKSLYMLHNCIFVQTVGALWHLFVKKHCHSIWLR